MFHIKDVYEEQKALEVEEVGKDSTLLINGISFNILNDNMPQNLERYIFFIFKVMQRGVPEGISGAHLIHFFLLGRINSSLIIPRREDRLQSLSEKSLYFLSEVPLSKRRRRR